jgi:GNAT superfamily N-acetyltransferase
MGKIQIESAKSSDMAFVLDAFWRTYIKTPYTKGVRPTVIIQKLESMLLVSQVLVARPVGDTDTVLGFIIYSESSFSWIHVKNNYRSKGIATALLAATHNPPGTYNAPFLTKEIKQLAATKGYKLHFKPYMPDEITLQIAEMLMENETPS